MQAPQTNILLLTDNYPPQRGGMAQSCDRIVNSLRSANIEVHILHFGSRKRKINTQTQVNGSHTSIPLEEDEAHTVNRAWLHIRKMAEQTLLTHIVAFGGFISLTAAPVFSQWLKLPLVILLRGNDFDQALFTSRKITVLQRAIEQATCIGTVTQEMQAKLLLMYPEKKVFFTPNSIDTKEWQPLKSDEIFAEDFRKKEAHGNKSIIGIFGHLKPKKGINFFLECLSKSQQKEAFHLLLVGELQASTQSLVEEYQINASLLPFMDRYELIKYYLACDAVVLPSFYDGMPNVLLEACALKVPVIAANIAGMHDVLYGVEDNLLFEAADAKSCLTILNRFARLSAKERIDLALNQFVHVRANFHQERELNSILQLFDSKKHG